MTKKRYSIHIFLTGFIGYIMGTTGYSLMGGENRVLYYLSGFCSNECDWLILLFLFKKEIWKDFKGNSA